ncbi:hypothetical protein ACJX0J_005340, partial [Zea mays]
MTDAGNGNQNMKNWILRDVITQFIDATTLAVYLLIHTFDDQLITVESMEVREGNPDVPIPWIGVKEKTLFYTRRESSIHQYIEGWESQAKKKLAHVCGTRMYQVFVCAC